MLVMVALGLLGLSATALAGGQDVLNDAKDNQRVDGCYSRAEFRAALRLANEDQRLYSYEIEAIQEAQITHVTVPGEPCGSGRSIPAHPRTDGSDGGAAPLWAGVLAAVGLVSAGAGLRARRSGRGDGS
jgi:hypothetical protein